MRIHSNGNVGIGVNAPAAKLSVSNNATVASIPNDVIAQFTNTDNTDTEVHIDTYGNGAIDDPALVFRRAAGTAASPSALRSGDYMGRLAWWGHNGTNFIDHSAKLEVSAAENWTISSNATRMEFLTTPTGATAPVRYMILSSAGNLGLDNYITSSNPTSKLDVNGSFAAAITTTSSNITLDATHHTVIITGGTPSVTLPTASTCTRRMYIIVNHTATARNISSYLNFSGTATTSVPANSSITVQSNGTSWYRIQ